MRVLIGILCSILIAAVNAAAPLSLHTVAEVAVGGDVTISLLGYDIDIGHSVSFPCPVPFSPPGVNLTVTSPLPTFLS